MNKKKKLNQIKLKFYLIIDIKFTKIYFKKNNQKNCFFYKNYFKAITSELHVIK